MSFKALAMKDNGRLQARAQPQPEWDIDSLPQVDLSSPFVIVGYQEDDLSDLGYRDGTPYLDAGYVADDYVVAEHVFTQAYNPCKVTERFMTESHPALLPTGGAAGQFLQKEFAPDYETRWHTMTAQELEAEPALGLPANDGSVLTSDTAGNRSWTLIGGGGLENLITRRDAIKICLLSG
jgi:hypothetical protein